MNDRVAVVTGGGTGIGRAISEHLARAGARVVVNYSRSKDDAEATVKAIREAGGTAIAVGADVSGQAERDRTDGRGRQRVRSTGIDLVNNAGLEHARVPHAEMEKLTDEIWDHVFDTNLRGAFYCVRAATPFLKQQLRRGDRNHRVGGRAAPDGQFHGVRGVERRHGHIDEISGPRAGAGDPRERRTAWIRPHALRRLDRKTHFPSSEKITPLRKLATVDDVAEAALFFCAHALGTTSAKHW